MSRRSWRRRCAPFVVVVMAAAAQLGCKQDQGDPCKEDNDCSGGMVCCKSSTRAEARGVCRPEDECDPGGTGRDAGNREEADAGDPAESGATDADAGSQDLPPAAGDGGSDGGGDATADSGT